MGIFDILTTVEAVQVDEFVKGEKEKRGKIWKGPQRILTNREIGANKGDWEASC